MRAGAVVVEVRDRNHQQDEQLAVADERLELHGGSGAANLIQVVTGRLRMNSPEFNEVSNLLVEAWSAAEVVH